MGRYKPQPLVFQATTLLFSPFQSGSEVEISPAYSLDSNILARGKVRRAGACIPLTRFSFGHGFFYLGIEVGRCRLGRRLGGVGKGGVVGALTGWVEIDMLGGGTGANL